MLQAKEQAGTWTLTQDQRWDLVLALSRLQDKRAVSLLAEEQARDKSSLAKRQVLSAKAAQSSFGEKLKQLQPIAQGESSLSAADRISILTQLFPEPQEELRLQYQNQFAQQFETVIKKVEPSVGRAYVMSLLPLDCRRPATPLLAEVKAKVTQDSLAKALLLAEENHNRCRQVLGYQGAS
jgi:hypothetical protein